MNRRQALSGILTATLPLLGRVSLYGSEGFVPLFPADDLSAWVEEFHKRVREQMKGKHAFSIKDGVLICDGSVGNVGFIRSTKTYGDFELKCEFRAPEGTNSGICFRAPAYGDGPTPAHTGYELQIDLTDGRDPLQSSGSFYSVNPALALVDIKRNGWNTVHIICNGPHVKAMINGTVVQDFDQTKLDSAKERPRSGYLFFQSHGGDIEFRNIVVKTRE